MKLKTVSEIKTGLGKLTSNDKLHRDLGLSNVIVHHADVVSCIMNLGRVELKNSAHLLDGRRGDWKRFFVFFAIPPATFTTILRPCSTLDYLLDRQSSRESRKEPNRESAEGRQTN